MIIFNDNSRQALVKQISFYIKAKRKIHDILGHKTQHPLSSSSQFTLKSSTNCNTSPNYPRHTAIEP